MIHNTQFSPHYTRRPPCNPRNPLFDPGKFGDRLWEYQKENLAGLAVRGDLKNRSSSKGVSIDLVVERK